MEGQGDGVTEDDEEFEEEEEFEIATTRDHSEDEEAIVARELQQPVTVVNVGFNPQRAQREIDALIRRIRNDPTILEVFTTFVPTNQAFRRLNFDVVAFLRAPWAEQYDYLLYLAEYHVIYGEAIRFRALSCGTNYVMANGERSTTECRSDDRKFQIGPGNRFNNFDCELDQYFDFEDRQCRRNPPQIVYPRNIIASNGIIHTLNEVMIPFRDIPITEPPSSAGTTMSPTYEFTVPPSAGSSSSNRVGRCDDGGCEGEPNRKANGGQRTVGY